MKAHADCNNIEKYRLATEDERQSLLMSKTNLKEPKAKEVCWKQFFGIEIEPDYKFKPFVQSFSKEIQKTMIKHVSLFC